LRVVTLLIALSALACRAEGPAEEPEEAPRARDVSDAHATLSGVLPKATGGFPSILLLEPLTPIELEAPDGPARLDQYNTDFHPHLLVVRVGQTVEFRNSEDTLHNVHVIDTETRDTAFNVATPVSGSYDYVFESPAVYDVSCGIHPSMAAFIIVTEAPVNVTADAAGAYTIESVPFGRYRAVVWNLDPSRRGEYEVDIAQPFVEWSPGELS